MKARIRYLVEDVDRHGNVRLYFWKRPGRKIRIRALPGTEAFSKAYDEALRGEAEKQTKTINVIDGVITGSFRWLCVKYISSRGYKELASITRTTQRGIIDSMCQEAVEPGATLTYADVPIAQISMKAVQVLRDRKVAVPHAANKRIKVLRKILKFGIAEGYASSNVARDVEFLKTRKGGHHTWTIDEVRKFEARHPIGTKPRLALALLLFTGVRRSDVVLLGRQMVKNGWMNFIEQKGKASLEKERSIPLLPQLKEVIDATPNNHLTYLVTEYGNPFSANGFGNWFRERCDEAGLPHCSAHGVRKAGATIAAENGATEHQLMAMFGWESPRQAADYTKKVRRKKLVGDAMHLIVSTDEG